MNVIRKKKYKYRKILFQCFFKCPRSCFNDCRNYWHRTSYRHLKIVFLLSVRLSAWKSLAIVVRYKDVLRTASCSLGSGCDFFNGKWYYKKCNQCINKLFSIMLWPWPAVHSGPESEKDGQNLTNDPICIKFNVKDSFGQLILNLKSKFKKKWRLQYVKQKLEQMTQS